jgi:hypothetical protein
MRRHRDRPTNRDARRFARHGQRGFEVERDTFDRLVRLLGATGSRRAALRLIASGALFGATATTSERTAAKRRRRGGRAGRAGARAVGAEQIPVPSICLTSGGTGCSKPQGNCATKPIGPGTNLRNCNFVNESGDLFETNFAGADLTGACFLAATLNNRPTFQGANVARVCFFETDLTGSDFRGANLRGATFCDADLNGADFRGSNLTDEQLARAGRVSCTTIKPNGKPAVQCAKGQTCNTNFGDCTCTLDSDCTVTGLDCTHAFCLSGFCACSSV